MLMLEKAFLDKTLAEQTQHICRQKHSCSNAINTAQQEGLTGHLGCHTS